MAAVDIAAAAEDLSNDLRRVGVGDQDQMRSPGDIWDLEFDSEEGVCAICLDEISLQDTALVKGCEHAYCVTCILEWASYSKNPTCPQCKHPFEFINLHRSLDGSLHDYMFEESVCLLLRATWFVDSLALKDAEEVHYEVGDSYEDENNDLDDDYYSFSPSLRIGNRRWGDNGFVRGGRQEAMPVQQSNIRNSGPSTSRGQNNEVSKSVTGRRAKRALKREAANKGGEEVGSNKNQLHLARLGRSRK